MMDATTAQRRDPEEQKPPTVPRVRRRADPPELAELAEWFLSIVDSLPREPFQLTPGVKVGDPEKAYAAWRLDIASTSPVRKQVLLQELQALHTVVERGGSLSVAPRKSVLPTEATPRPSARLITARPRIVTPDQHRQEQRRRAQLDQARRSLSLQPP